MMTLHLNQNQMARLGLSGTPTAQQLLDAVAARATRPAATSDEDDLYYELFPGARSRGDTAAPATPSDDVYSALFPDE